MSTTDKNAKLELVITLPNGHSLYREKNEVGGHRYWSDEIGGGVMVWDTSLVSHQTLLFALAAEKDFQNQGIR